MGSATDDRGNVATLFALAASAVIAGGALAVDFTAAYTRRDKLQSAADTAALATLTVLLEEDEGKLRRRAVETMAVNLGHRQFELLAFKVDKKAFHVELRARSTEPTVFARLLGEEAMPVSVGAVAQGGSQTLELALALDNSGSMADFGRIDALKDASKALVKTLMEDKLLKGRVSIGVAPFASSVNVGPAHAGAAWLDTAGVSPIHGENFDGQGVRNRFTLFADLKNTPWAGCVEARPGGLDVTDAAPTTADPRSLFVPMFAPDEPDSGEAVTVKNKTTFVPYYPNNYLSDDGGDCTAAQRGGTDAARQSRTCKYKGAAPSKTDVWGVGATVGPNFLCETVPVLPLTDQQGTLISRISTMKAKGGTNIVEGAMWGWRVLSPGAPFTEGQAYGAASHRKVMVLMTDGDNNWMGIPSSMGGLAGFKNENMSIYGAHGFSNKQRIGAPSRDTKTLSGQIDARLKLACDNIKAAGIEIYTVSLSPQTETGKTLMRDCATRPEWAYAPATAAELRPVFDEIAESIKRMRLAR